jgi:putative membrane protein insertion efficiency factor
VRGLKRGLSLVWRAPRLALIGLVRLYRLLLSPWVGSSCRFSPTCSAYALEALDRHGAVLGGGLVAWRLLRCNPACHGGCDPVPDNPARLPWKRGAGVPTSRGAAGLFTGLSEGPVSHDADAGPADPDSHLSKSSP